MSRREGTGAAGGILEIGGSMDATAVPVLVPILSIAGGWVGAYFGAYFREKGKNLATREDIDRITHITEDIKASISGDL
jgi:hypothetical protein